MTRLYLGNEHRVFRLTTYSFYDLQNSFCISDKSLWILDSNKQSIWMLAILSNWKGNLLRCLSTEEDFSVRIKKLINDWLTCWKASWDLQHTSATSHLRILISLCYKMDSLQVYSYWAMRFNDIFTLQVKKLYISHGKSWLSISVT